MAQHNANREKIRLLISLSPGLHLRAVQRLLGLSFSSTRYHVETLQKSGEIVRSDEGGYSRLYPNGISDSDRVLFSTVNNSTDLKILDCMIANRRISYRELCERTAFAKSTVSEHLSRLAEIGVVKADTMSQNRIEYELIDPDRIKDLIAIQVRALLKKATDRFIDLWDF